MLSLTTTELACDGPALATARVKVSSSPTWTGSLCVLTIDRSADCTTSICAVSVLLPGTGSVVGDSTVAVLVKVPGSTAASTATVTSSGGADPPATSGEASGVSQTTTWGSGPEGAHTHGAAADTNDRPAGRVSVTVSGPWASEGPRFSTAMRYVVLVPARTGSVPSWVLVSARSALASTRTVEVAVLLSGSSPGVDVDTAEVLVSTVPSGTLVATRATTRMTLVVGAPAPTCAGMVARAQTTSRPRVAQSQPSPAGGVTETGVVPGGSSSRTTTASASEGPLLVTVRSKATVSPAATTPEPTVSLSIATSVRSSTVTVSLSVLLSGSGSPIGPETSARLVIVPGPESGRTSRVTVIGGASSPAVSAASRTHRTRSDASVQTHPLPVAETKDVPAGTASVTTMSPGVLEGPLLVTVRVQSSSSPATAVTGVRLGDREVDHGVDVGDVGVDVVVRVRVGRRRRRPGPCWSAVPARGRGRGRCRR